MSGSAAARYQLTDRCIAAVRAERTAGLQQQELCRLVGMSPVTLSRWLHRHADQRPTPDDQRLKRLARVLDLPMEACIEEVGELRPR
jgi:transcriptional regulator with XRE-family HTH domain